MFAKVSAINFVAQMSVAYIFSNKRESQFIFLSEFKMVTTK